MKIATMGKVKQAKYNQIFMRLQSACYQYFATINSIPELRKRYEGLIRQAKGEGRSEFGYYLCDRITSVAETINHLKPKRFLDLGSGPGILQTYLHELFTETTFVGYEIEKAFVEDGVNIFHANILEKDILKLEAVDVADFDVIYFYEPFTSDAFSNEEGYKPKLFVENLSKVLTKGQYILYIEAGAIRNYLTPENGFKILTIYKGVKVYEFLGLPK